MKYLNYLFLLPFSICISSKSLSSDYLSLDDVQLPSEKWLELCQNSKHRFSKQDHKKGVFIPFTHPLNAGLEVSYIQTEKLKFPFLKGMYDLSNISILDSDSSFKVVSDTGLVMIVKVNDSELHNDYWAKVDRVSGEKIPSPGGLTYTQKIYGGPVSSLELEINSFLYSPSNLSCTEESKLQDIKVILALEGKLFSPVSGGAFPSVSLVEVQGVSSLVEFEELENRYHLGISSEFNNKNYNVDYYFTKNQLDLMYDVAASFAKQIRGHIWSAPYWK